MGLRILTGGESHGPAVVSIVEGMPRGVPASAGMIDRELARRQLGYGRGGRMKIENDRVRILSGIRHGITMGSPVTLLIENVDHPNWVGTMGFERPTGNPPAKVTKPRPGHGDLAGMLKYGSDDARDILERASARETASRVAAGALARSTLREFGMRVYSRVIRIGRASLEGDREVTESGFGSVDDDPVRCPDASASKSMVEEIERASEEGCSLGGVFEVAAFGVVPGLGSHAHFDRRLDARLFGALGSIPGIKGVEAGDGFALGGVSGHLAHDEMLFDERLGIRRKTNHAGGLEAGMTNGETLLLRAAMKPIPSMAKPLSTVDTQTLEAVDAFKERADICAVPAAAVVGEAMVALVLADAVTEKFGCDSLSEMMSNFEGYLGRIGGLWKRGGKQA